MNSKKIDLRPDIIKTFIETKDEKVVCGILKEHSNQIIDYQKSYISARGLKAKLFTVLVSKDPSFVDYFVVQSSTKKIYLKALQAGQKYYYRIYGDENLKNLLEEGSIETKNTPGVFCTIDGMCNIRDIGGWKTTNGERIKHGLIIRGIRTNDHDNVPIFTEAGYLLLKDALKIKGEIDLRHSQDNFGQTQNIFNKDYPYITAPFTTCCHILPSFNEGGPYHRVFDKNTPDSFNKIFTFLSEKSNYPVFIHCNSGADRTGTICMVIEGLLGVKEEDIYRDFELTSFTPASQRWRSKINDDNTFDDSGVMQDDQYNYVAAMKCLRTIKEEYGKGKTLQEAITNYLKVVCSVSDEQINTLKEIMLEKPSK